MRMKCEAMAHTTTLRAPKGVTRTAAVKLATGKGVCQSLLSED